MQKQEEKVTITRIVVEKDKVIIDSDNPTRLLAELIAKKYEEYHIARNKASSNLNNHTEQAGDFKL